MISSTALLAATLAAAVALAQASGIPAQQPVFRSGVELVTVDVTVLDSGGTPVEGLGADRFKIAVDGAPRRVVWAEYVRHRSAPLEPPGRTDHFSSNEHLDAGRVVLVAVDQMHIRRVEGLAALRAASAFVDSLDRSDRIAASPLNHGGAIAFTADHAAVKRYLERLTGEGSSPPVQFNIGLTEALAISDGSRTRLDQVVLRECGEPIARVESMRRMAEAEGVRDPCPIHIEQESRAMAQQARTEARLSIDALGRLIARLADIEGPKTLVLISEGLVAEPQLFELTALGAAAQAARVTIYVLQLEVPVFDASESRVSPTFSADLQVRADGLARLAGAARGALFHLVGADPHPFRRILSELSGYYLVAFEAADTDRDGRTHRIAVKTDAAGVTVRARPAFKVETAPAPAAIGSHLERLLRSPRLSTELPLRVAAHSFRDAAADRLKVVVSAETDHAGSGREVTIAFVVVGDKGVIVASGAGATASGRYSQPTSVPPGQYMLKAAAIDDSGRQGSVERRFDARLAQGGAVQLSDLMIAEPTSDPAAPLRPAVARASGNRIIVYLEAYGPSDWTPPDGSVVIDVVGTGNATPVMSAPGVIRRAANDAGRWTVTADVALASLPPGPYFANARVSFPGVPPQRLTRAFVVAPRVP